MNESVAPTIQSVQNLIEIFSKLEKTPKILHDGLRIHPSEAHLILNVGKMTGTTVTSLSKVLHMTKPSISEMISRLVVKGYLERRSIVGNKKSQCIGLTEKGKSVYTEIFHFHEKIYGEIGKILEDLPIETLKLFTKKVNIINKRIYKFLK